MKQAKRVTKKQTGPDVDRTPNAHPFVGMYVVVRTYSAGVHVGVLQAASGKEVRLSEARRIWSWLTVLTNPRKPPIKDW